MKLVQYNEYLVCTVDTDGLVIYHQGISSYSSEYVPMLFQLVMVWWCAMRCTQCVVLEKITMILNLDHFVQTQIQGEILEQTIFS